MCVCLCVDENGMMIRLDEGPELVLKEFEHLILREKEVLSYRSYRMNS